jgi:phenylalanyl-tRNA synthetase alpha chain
MPATLQDFLAELDAFAAAATGAFTAATDAATLEAARVEFLGAKAGRLKSLQKGLGAVPPADKPAAGKRFNELKQSVERAFEEADQRVALVATTGSSGGEAYDPTLPGRRPRLGRLHPITQTIEELKEIMGRLGFSVASGPEIEDEWHNFEALNIPADHPARDPLENFYLATGRVGADAGLRGKAPHLGPQYDDGRTGADAGQRGKPPHPSPLPEGEGTRKTVPRAMLLRSQTSTVQIRVMERTPPPVRIISLGRVYRPDTPDATHYPMFHQIEGLMVDRGVTMAHLKSVLRLFARSYLGGDVHIRFRPSFFPFTEPSVEVDMSWRDGWIEMGGAGMVDPHVLRAVGYDPEEVTGFAFGLGVERVCMRRHGIDDIRELYRNDVRFLEQF